MDQKIIVVSIIIPIYNRSHLIHETIQSVMDQTTSTWELIIVDDGSTDNLENGLRKYSDERIRYYKLEHSGIISKVRNFGMHHAKGSYIAFLDSDDLWKPHKLEFQLSLLNKYPQAAFTFSHAEQFGPGAIPPPALETFFIGNIFYAQLIEERFVFYPTTLLFKKEILETVGFLDENLTADDIDFFLRIAWKHEGIFCGEKLARLRKHDGNISQEREFTYSTGNLQMYNKFLVEGLLTRRQHLLAASKQHYKLGLLYLQRHKPSEAVKSFMEYIKIKPFHYKGWIRIFFSVIKLATNFVYQMVSHFRYS